MKYIDFKRFKFSTIFKNLSFRRYNFFKFINFSGLNLRKTYKNLISQRIDFKKLYSKINIRKFSLNTLGSFRQYSDRTLKKKDFSISKLFLLHLPLSIIFFIILYLAIPTLYNYDKSTLEKVICKEKNIKCSIKGEVGYTFFPSPRIKINNVIIKDNVNEKKIIASIKNVSAKLSIKNLLTKDKHKFKKIEVNKFIINLNIDDFKKYKNVFANKNYFIPTILSKGEIIFLEKTDQVATIKDVDLKLNLDKDSKIVELKGKDRKSVV